MTDQENYDEHFDMRHVTIRLPVTHKPRCPQRSKVHGKPQTDTRKI